LSSPWDGKPIPIKDRKPFVTAISPPKPVSNNIVSEVKTAAVDNSDLFKRADQLKHMIDKPTDFGGWHEWSFIEKNITLRQAKADYKKIQSEKENIKTSFNGIDSLFDEKSRQSTKLSEDARNIESKLNEIENHLSQYEDKLKLLKEIGDNKTKEELEWESEALKQISNLKHEKNGLSNSLTEIQSLQLNLNDAEKNTSEELKKLSSGGAGGGPRDGGPSVCQSAEGINFEMNAIKGEVFNLSAGINKICTVSSNLFSNLFESIKKISSKIASQFASANATLAESSTLLSNYPAPTMQMR